MFAKGIALTALAVSTPFAFYHAQDPVPHRPSRTAPSATNSELQRARAELQAARQELRRLRRQLDAALDRLDQHYSVERDRNCSPSRSRALMSHYQWLRDEGHGERAQGALAKVVQGVGDDPNRLNRAAWDLMTDKETAGRFDEVALALARRMQEVAGKRRGRAGLHYNHLDTIALAQFLNGDIEQAIRTQEQAIAKGGRGDDFRRRLRTYEAARAALAKAGTRTKGRVVPAAATMVASSNEDE